MEARFFFINLGRAVLRAAPYLVLAAQVVDLVNRGLDDAPKQATDNPESLFPDGEAPISIQ